MESSSPAPFSFEGFPSAVLGHIALATVLPTHSGLLTPASLRTFHSLVLTSRSWYAACSLTTNPNLYAEICRRMFDIQIDDSEAHYISPLGWTAELKARVQLLNRIKGSCIPSVDHDSDAVDDKRTVGDLGRMYAMMLENKSKNLQQLQLAQTSQCLEALFRRFLVTTPSPSVLAQDPVFCLTISLLWMMSSKNTVLREDSEYHIAIIGFLWPLAQQPYQSDGSRGTTVFQTDSVLVNYFGVFVSIALPPVTPFAWLLVVARLRESSMYIRAFSENGRLEADFEHCNSSPRPEMASYKMPARRYAAGALQGVWKGAFFTLCKVRSDAGEIIDTHSCQVPMTCHLREYHAFSHEHAMGWAADDDEQARGRAWFPGGTEWHETQGSLRLYDSTKGRWACYRSHAHVSGVADFGKEVPEILDTVIVGSSATLPRYNGAEFTFHGRICRRDGSVVLVRQPKSPSGESLGKWVFHGYIHGERHIVGDWRPVNASVQGAEDWFALSKETA